MSPIPLGEFRKLELRVAEIVEVEEIPGTDRLWKLTIDVGSEKKQIVAGIKNAYSKEALVGRSVVVVNNLEPAVIRGVESKGMLLAAKSGEDLVLVTVDKNLPAGSLVS